jgi:hypothetical protein
MGKVFFGWIQKMVVLREQKKTAAYRHFYNFDTAKSVGVVFVLDGDKLKPDVVQLIDYLKQRKISYSVLGYWDNMEEPSGFTVGENISVMTKKDLNWYGKPRGEVVDNFLKQKYDMIIDFSKEEVYPIQYIISAAKVSTAVGGVYYENCPYNVIIDVKEGNDYLDQIRHYLSNINKPQISGNE